MLDTSPQSVNQLLQTQEIIAGLCPPDACTAVTTEDDGLFDMAAPVAIAQDGYMQFQGDTV